jgi:hypothetical protein
MKQKIFAICVLGFVFLLGNTALAQEPASSPLLPEPNLELLSSLTGEGTWQLRIYTINRGRLDDFVNAWLQGVYPVRLEHGFKIPAAWVIRERNQFVWVIGYDGPESWEDAQAGYYGSAARTGLDVDPLQFIAHGDSYFITPVSPKRQ